MKRHCKGEPYRIGGKRDPLLQTKKKLTTLYNRIDLPTTIALNNILVFEKFVHTYLFLDRLLRLWLGVQVDLLHGAGLPVLLVHQQFHLAKGSLP